jgi:hypothetical protein
MSELAAHAEARARASESGIFTRVPSPEVSIVPLSVGCPATLAPFGCARGPGSRTRGRAWTAQRLQLCAALLSLAAGLSPLLLASRALAEATVVVELKRPDGSAAEGTVQLTQGASKHRCTTDKSGRCALAGIAGGVYVVNVEQPGKPAPKDKTVVIPPTGEVKLIVNAN